LPEIAGHQPPEPENPVAHQARRRGRLHLRQREKPLRVFQRPFGVSSGVLHHPDTAQDREVKRCSGCRRGSDAIADSCQMRCRPALGDPRAASLTINHKLRGATPLPASAENLQRNFSSRLNKHPPMASESPIFSSSSSTSLATRSAAPARLPDCPGWNSRPRPRYNLVAHRVTFASLRIAGLYILNGALRQ
jgi:hypothetical protein